MPVTEYVEGIRRQILDTPHVVSHSLGYEDRPPLAAIVRGSVTFADGSCIHFKEFLQLRPVITRLKYAYHYATSTHALMFATTTPGTLPRGTSPHTQTIGILPTKSVHLPPLHSSLSCAKQRPTSRDRVAVDALWLQVCDVAVVIGGGIKAHGYFCALVYRLHIQLKHFMAEHHTRAGAQGFAPFRGGQISRGQHRLWELVFGESWNGDIFVLERREDTIPLESGAGMELGDGLDGRERGWAQDPRLLTG